MNRLRWLTLALLALAALVLVATEMATDARATPAQPSEELETFEPSEKVPADSAISFPVDI